MANEVWTQYWIGKLQKSVKARGFSPRTFENYRNCVADFLQQNPMHPAKIQASVFPNYFVSLLEKRKLAESTVNLHREAIRFFYRDVLTADDPFAKIPRVKEPQKLPRVLSVEDIRRLIVLTRNIKHRLLLSVAYGGGLRLAEVVNLKVADIDFDRSVVWVREGKGRKDRIVMLSAAIRDELKQYIVLAKPQNHLFESDRGAPLCRRTVQAVFEQACERAKLKGRIGIHSLRHSFATHLLESGTDLRYIQALLGHQSSKTTEIYTHVATHHVAKIVSPFDRLRL